MGRALFSKDDRFCMDINNQIPRPGPELHCSAVSLMDPPNGIPVSNEHDVIP